MEEGSRGGATSPRSLRLQPCMRRGQPWAPPRPSQRRATRASRSRESHRLSKIVKSDLEAATRKLPHTRRRSDIDLSQRRRPRQGLHGRLDTMDHSRRRQNLRPHRLLRHKRVLPHRIVQRQSRVVVTLSKHLRKTPHTLGHPPDLLHLPLQSNCARHAHNSNQMRSALPRPRRLSIHPSTLTTTSRRLLSAPSLDNIRHLAAPTEDRQLQHHRQPTRRERKLASVCEEMRSRRPPKVQGEHK